MKLLVLFLIASFISLSAFSGTRIAIVSDTKSDTQELVITRLSADKDIELLERNEIDKVIKEQKLSAQGIDEKQALSLGKFLKTDLFAVIEIDTEKKTPIGIIVFDAETGIRCWDSALPEADIEKTAEFIATAVKEAMSKRQKALEGKLTYLSLLSVRNADLPREKDPFCKAVGILLMCQLGNSPGIAVLERSHLDWLNKERILPGMEAQNKLLAATMLLELEISRAKDGKGIKATIFLPEKQKISSESSDGNPADFARMIASQLADSLKVDVKSNNVDCKKEAGRFYNEAIFFHNHKDWENALNKIESAFALDNENGKYQTLLASYLFDMALFLIDPPIPDTNTEFNHKRKISVAPDNFTRSLQLVDRSLDYRLNLLRECENVQDPEERQKVIDNILGWRGMEQYFQAATSGISDKKEIGLLLGSCQRKALSCLIDFDYANRKSSIKDLHTFSAYDNWLSANLQDIRLFSENSQICVETMTGISWDWLKFLQKYGAASNPSTSIVEDFISIQKYSQLQLSGADFKIIGGYFKKMQSHPLPDVQAYGEFGLLWVELQENGISGDELVEKVKAFQESVQKKITSLPKDTDKIRRKYMYTCITDALSNLTGSGDYYKARQKMEVKLFRFMESRKDFSADVASSAIRDSAAYEENQSEALKIMDDSRLLIASSDTRILDEDLKCFNEDVVSIRAFIISKNPDLVLKQVKYPWIANKLLFTAADNNMISRIVCPVLSENKLYFAGLGVENDKSSFAQLVIIDLVSGTCHFGAKSALNWDVQNCYTLNEISHYNEREGNAACFSNGKYYLATQKSGIYIFPENDTQVRVVSKENGLPSNYIQSLAVLNNKIYAGLGETEKESFLISYDPVKNNTALLASSRRKEKVSPFDDISPPVQFQHLAADPDRNQIIMFACLRNNPANGLWSIDINDNKMKQLVQVDFTSAWASPINNAQIIISDPFETFRYDIPRGDAYLLNSFSSKPQNKKYFKTANLCSYRAIAPHAMIDGWLWSADYFGRISPDGKSQEVFSFHSGAEMFVPNVFMQATLINNKKCVIAADQRQIWIFEMN